MRKQKKDIIIFKRLIIWTFYLFSGFILYFKKGNIHPSLITFSRVIYPLSIFWLQLRIKNRDNLLPIDPSMETSQLWFNILPVLASFISVIFTTINALFYIFLIFN